MLSSVLNSNRDVEAVIVYDWKPAWLGRRH
jgi:hypothetical protein